MPEHVGGRHRDTLAKIFAHPSSGNVEWREARSLLEAVGSVHEAYNGKLKVTVGPESEVLSPPRGKDIDQQMLGDLRRMLTGAGLGPDRARPVEDQRSRDYGDSRWGEP
ncbi:MAG TPA: hypothetical protein VEJ23_06935 [Solirubrobacteraceae bacterium]|nr:hypothetical protein [Solirubrobacteraceae bacterium]